LISPHPEELNRDRAQQGVAADAAARRARSGRFCRLESARLLSRSTTAAPLNGRALGRFARACSDKDKMIMELTEGLVDGFFDE
jgi:hypothetical protein